MIPESRMWRTISVGARRAAAWPFRVAAARATLRTLANMDRRELADIGLNPSDVSDASALPLDRDPTELLARGRASGVGTLSGRRLLEPGRPLDDPDDRPGPIGRHGGRNRSRPGRAPPRQNRLSCAPAALAARAGLRNRSVRSSRDVSRKPSRRAAISNRRPIIQA